MRDFICAIGISLGFGCSGNSKPPLEKPIIEKPPVKHIPVPNHPTDLEIMILNFINKARTAKGLETVSFDENLNCAAKMHALDVGSKKICSHTGTDGSTPTTRAGKCGTRWTGEIIACGQKSAEEAVQAWHHSPGHAKIMYSPSQKKVGVYMFNNYWVAIFN